MNILSHYFLDKDHPSPYYKLGLILPDLIKGFNQKLRRSVFGNPILDNKHHQEIQNGIRKHYLVDQSFHQLPIFLHYSELFKQNLIEENISSLNSRTYFTAHIFVEMLLDRLLIKQYPDLPVKLHEDLNSIELSIMSSYLTCIGKLDFKNEFFGIFNSFIKSSRLLHYSDNENFINALLWVYKKINPVEIRDIERKKLVALLVTFEKEHSKTMFSVFNLMT